MTFVLYQPGGTINDSIVVMHGGDKLSNRFNIIGPTVYWDDDEDGGKRYLIKDKDEVLPMDSDWLSKPEVPPADILDLTKDESHDTMFEHRDIIKIDEPVPEAPYVRSETVEEDSKYPSEQTDETTR